MRRELPIRVIKDQFTLRRWEITPVLRLLETIRRTEPPNQSNMATWARNQVSCFISSVGSTNANLKNGNAATNKNTRVCCPVTGSVSRIVLPDQSTSIDWPALWPTRDAAPVTRRCC